MSRNLTSNQMCIVGSSKNVRGFTLIELLIAVAIAGILMAIAVPSYTNFVERSKMRAAQADLVSLSVNIENAYQRTLSYPNIEPVDNVDALYSGWSASSPASVFTFSADSKSSPSAYTLTATGQGSLTNCVITLTNDNIRANAGCPQGSGSWL